MDTIIVMNWDSMPMVSLDDDVLLPSLLVADIRKHMASIKALPYQAGDILLCSYPKSGTHWVWHLIAKIVRGGNLEEEPPALNGLLEAVSELGLDSLPSPRILVSHLHPKRLPTAHWNTGKIVLVLRNPKDVAVSLFAHLKNDAQLALPQTWEEYLESFMSDDIMNRSWFANTIAWDRVVNKEKKDNVIVLYYEELKANPIECLKKLQNHLGIEHGEEELEKIVEECSFLSLRGYCGKKRSGIRRQDGELMCFAKKDGTDIIYRKGIIGDWKNHFTVSQNEAFEKLIEEKLNDVEFEFTYE